jgi:hypothetical protein
MERQVGGEEDDPAPPLMGPGNSPGPTRKTCAGSDTTVSRAIVVGSVRL